MASVFAAGEDNLIFGHKNVTKKSSKLSWLNRRRSSKCSPFMDKGEGEFRLIQLSKRIFVAQSLKSLTLIHGEETVRVLQGWISDPNGVLPESLVHAKIVELFPEAKCNKYGSSLWIKEIFYEINPLKNVSDDEGHFLYIIRFYTNLKTMLEQREMDDLQKSTDVHENVRKAATHRFSTASPDFQPFANRSDCTVNAPPSTGFTSVKMCSVNAPRRCSKSHCLASKFGSVGSKSPVNLQAHFDMLIQNIFNGAVLAEPRIARSLPKELVCQLNIVQDNCAIRKKLRTMLSKSFELGDDNVDLVVGTLESMARKASVSKAESEESGCFVGTEELVERIERCSSEENDSEHCDILELKTCTPSTNLLTNLNSLQSLFMPVVKEKCLSSENVLSSINIPSSDERSVDQGINSETSSPVIKGQPTNPRTSFVTVSDDLQRNIRQSSHNIAVVDGPSCQSSSDTVTVMQPKEYAVPVGNKIAQSQDGNMQISIQFDQSKRDTEKLPADQSKAALSQISVQMNQSKDLNGFVTEMNNQPKPDYQISNVALGTPPPLVLTRKTMSKEICSLSSDSSISQNARNSLHIETTREKRARMFSCCTSKR